VQGGLILFVTTYYKGQSFSKSVKTVHSYIICEVGEVVIYFLGLSWPFVTMYILVFIIVGLTNSIYTQSIFLQLKYESAWTRMSYVKVGNEKLSFAKVIAV
jgi:hypothetical protein